MLHMEQVAALKRGKGSGVMPGSAACTHPAHGAARPQQISSRPLLACAGVPAPGAPLVEIALGSSSIMRVEGAGLVLWENLVRGCACA